MFTDYMSNSFPHEHPGEAGEAEAYLSLTLSDMQAPFENFKENGEIAHNLKWTIPITDT